MLAELGIDALHGVRVGYGQEGKTGPWDKCFTRPALLE